MRRLTPRKEFTPPTLRATHSTITARPQALQISWSLRCQKKTICPEAYIFTFPMAERERQLCHCPQILLMLRNRRRGHVFELSKNLCEVRPHARSIQRHVWFRNKSATCTSKKAVPQQWRVGEALQHLVAQAVPINIALQALSRYYHAQNGVFPCNSNTLSSHTGKCAA